MVGDLPINPLTHLWHRIEASSLLCHKLSKFMKIINLAIVVVLELVEDERTFNNLSFMKNKLKNWLSIHLPIVVGMHGQKIYSIEDFPYYGAYEE